VRDALVLVSAFGYRHVDAVVGHDFGSSVAAWCALVRPDVFRALAITCSSAGTPCRARPVSAPSPTKSAGNTSSIWKR